MYILLSGCTKHIFDHTQAISLRLPGANGEDVLLQCGDGASGGSVQERLSTGVMGPPPSQPHHLHHQQSIHYRPPPPSHIANYNYSGNPPQQMIVRSSLHQQPQQQHTILHHSRQVHAIPQQQQQIGLAYAPEQQQVVSQSSYVIPANDHSQQGASYRVGQVQQGRQILVKQQSAHPNVQPHQQTQQQIGIAMQQQPQQVQQQQIISHNPQQQPQQQSMVAAGANVVKNSPLLVGLLKQPDQVKMGQAAGQQEMGLASSHLTSLAANHHYTNTHQQVHRQIVNPSVINQYSSSTRSKDGLTTHQQVYSGGSVITNARVPSGLQQHPQATGKPPPQPHQQQVVAVKIPQSQGVQPASRNNNHAGLIQHQQQQLQIPHQQGNPSSLLTPQQRVMLHNSSSSPSPAISPSFLSILLFNGRPVMVF